MLLPDAATALTITLGALAAGFVAGLSGSGTAMVATGIWLTVLAPVPTTILVLICAVATQLGTIPTIWREVRPARVLPFMIPGLMGVPLGLAVSRALDPQVFKLGVGCVICVFAAFMLLWRNRPPVTWGGRWADACVGLIGGVLGGFAGLSGPAPTIWATLRGWSKDQKRSVFQTFNMSILATALAGHVVAGNVDRTMLLPVALALPGTFVGARLGLAAYKRLSDRNFNDVVMGLLLVSGLVLVVG